MPATKITLISLFFIPIAFSIPTRQVTNSSKAGLGWGGGDGADIQEFTTTGKVSWFYTWNPESWVPVSSSAGLEFVPMLWGEKSTQDFVSTINQTIAEWNVTAVLGMNEPQESGQSNLTPEQGAAMWQTYLEPLRAQGIRLGSPAPSSAPSGKIWLNQFLQACGANCTVDFIALHWYDVNATAFIDYLEDFNRNFSKPIWVTEWACQNFNDKNKQCTQDDVVLFLNETQSYMDNAAFVERYAWFGAMQDVPAGVNEDDKLMDSSGKINDLGKQYIGAEPPRTSGSGNADGPNAPGGSDGMALLNKAWTASIKSIGITIILTILELYTH